jgi:phosphoglycolate phosphatase-like HAD superfamily hydrolase
LDDRRAIISKQISFHIMLNIKNYELVIFDCDGVILNSNQIKSKAFFEVARDYSVKAANELVEFNREKGGVSRNIKITYFIEEILPKYGIHESSADKLLEEFGTYVFEGLSSCDVSEALPELRRECGHQKWAVVSGGNQAELHRIFERRGLAKYFDLGVWGSPADKYQIIANHFDHFLPSNVLFIGDSKLDFKVANEFNFDFLFISAWTEFADWKSFTRTHNILNVPLLSDLVDCKKNP